MLCGRIRPPCSNRHTRHWRLRTLPRYCAGVLVVRCDEAGLLFDSGFHFCCGMGHCELNIGIQLTAELWFTVIPSSRR